MSSLRKNDMKLINIFLLNLLVTKYTKKITKDIIFKIFNFNRINILKINSIKIEQIYDDYNLTYLSERSIEIPFSKFLINKYIKLFNNPNILEVGNTLIHYENDNKIKRTILDKYEVYPDVINKDIEDFTATEKFDLIFSISTLEHVGSDYNEEFNELKFERSIKNCLNLLNKNGYFIITLPIYYKKNVDYFIFNEKKFKEKYFFVKKNFQNDWKISNQEEVQKNKSKLIYNKNYPCANAVFVGVIKKNY